VVAFAVTGSLASAHEYSLPRPERTSRVLSAALRAQRVPQDGERLAATHVMYAACSCSQRIVDHLESRHARGDVAEHVVLVGEDETMAKRLSKAGFRLTQLSPLQLKQQYDIEAAPLLIVSDAAGNVVYLGGYTTRKQGPDIQDIAVIDKALAGAGSFELPVLGCAVSRALQRVLDPFALKYRSEEASVHD
jgi:hypothetical protein